MPKSERVFVRGVLSDRYSLARHREEQHAANRVRGEKADVGQVGLSDPERRGRWRLRPGDEEFLTQTIELHFLHLGPGESNKGHGHQNDAAMYIVSGAGYDVHDGTRYPWSTGDLLIVHNDSVHRHFNTSSSPLEAVVLKAKASWMFLGLWQQGAIGSSVPAAGGYGPRVDWDQLWSPGSLGRKKVVKQDDGGFVMTENGRIRWLAGKLRPDVRCYSLNLGLQYLDPGETSGQKWEMADEVCYVLEGSGLCRQWDVQAEMSDKYYAHIATAPEEYQFSEGDLVYVPQNSVVELENTGGSPCRVLRARNRLFEYLGYDNQVYLSL